MKEVKTMPKEDIGKLIKEETEKRLKIMEDESYVYPEKADKKDYIAISLCVAASIALIVLCMMGVIK